MIVKIIKCSNPCSWYSDEINNLFDVDVKQYTSNKIRNKIRYKLKNNYLSINTNDCVIIKDVNKKTEYRILTNELGSYPQVRSKRFFWSFWKRIGTHPCGEFGLYDDLRYPLDKNKCEQIIEEYNIWSNKNFATKIETYHIK